MKVFSAYKKGLKSTFQKKKMWLFLYLINLLFAFLAAGPFSDLLESELANSKVIQHIFGGFDYTVFMEFYQQNSGAIWAFLGQAIILVFVFFVFNIFFSGGIINTFYKNKEHFILRNFWYDCSQFFWRFLRLTFYFLMFHAVLLAIFGVLFYTIIEGGSNANLVSEVTIISGAKIIFPIYAISAIILSMIQDYAKIHIVSGDKKMLTKPILEVFKLTFKNFVKTASLYLLNILTILIIFGIYRLLQTPFTSDNMMGIFILFLVGQLFLFGRIGVKLLNLGSATWMYKYIANQPIVEVDQGFEEV
jgi:hypothetical protein